MKIRALLLDFDGTALMPNQVFLSLRTMHAIRCAIAKGVEIIPCTGRNEDTIPMQIENEKKIRYWVTSNGGRVVDRQTDDVIYSCTFTPQESGMLCSLFEGRGWYAEIAADGHIFVERAVNDRIWEYPVPWHHIWYLDQHRQIPVTKLSTFFPSQGIGVEKVNLYGLSPDEEKSLAAELAAAGIAEVIPGPGNPPNFQFFPKRQDRREAVSALLDRLGYGYESVMSIGDGPMDKFMIEKAACGVAVGNAPDEIKACADYVTAPYDEDGVALAIEKLILEKD